MDYVQSFDEYTTPFYQPRIKIDGCKKAIFADVMSAMCKINKLREKSHLQICYMR